MNRVSKRAWLVLVVALLIVVLIAAFFVKYLLQAEDWVTFPGSPHVYSGSNPDTGLVTDRNETLLLDSSDGRTYTEDLMLRQSIMHLLGDRYGYIEAPVLGTYSDKTLGFNRVTGLYSTSDAVSTSRLTISAEAQTTALNALSGRKGTVGVYNYKTGEILCAVTAPTYDPDNMPDIENDTTGAYDGVYVNRFFNSKYTPGSVFKLVTLAAGLEQVDDLKEQTFTCEGSVIVGGELITCTSKHGHQTLGEALTNSCNCAFASITEQVGMEQMNAYAEQLGITSPLSFDGITTAAGSYDVEDASAASFAWSGIGQYKDLVNPCSFMTYMGMIANGGSAAEPYLMASITRGNRTTYTAKTTMIDSGLNTETTEQMASMMRDNVVNKYGTWNFPDVTICAKSGTAEVSEGLSDTALFAGFVLDEAYPLAFIVVVEEGGYGSDAAAPIAGQVLQACIDSMRE